MFRKCYLIVSVCKALEITLTANVMINTLNLILMSIVMTMIKMAAIIDIMIMTMVLVIHSMIDNDYEWLQVSCFESVIWLKGDMSAHAVCPINEKARPLHSTTLYYYLYLYLILYLYLYLRVQCVQSMWKLDLFTLPQVPNSNIICTQPDIDWLLYSNFSCARLNFGCPPV